MKLLVSSVLFVLLFVGMAQASPFLVCDAPKDLVEYYVVTGLPSGMGAEKILPDATKKWGFSLDLATLPVGEYTVKAKACIGLWGCSVDSSPFSFTRPASVPFPNGIRLTP